MPLPVNCAVMARAPGEMAVVLHSAVPCDSATAAQPAMTLPLSRNTTAPVGVPALPVTVAVNETDCPAVEGLREATRAVVEFTANANVAADALPDAGGAPAGGGAVCEGGVWGGMSLLPLAADALTRL